MKRIFAIFSLAFGLTSAAQAGILIEPYLGYETGAMNITQAADSSELEDKLSGTGFGMRLGYKFLIPWVALDYTANTGKADRTAGGEYDFTKSGLGVVVGADIPLVRVWAGYGFSNDLIYKEALGGGLDVKFKGTYTKVGVGLGFIPFVSLNLEYKINDYKKVDVGGGETDIKNVFSATKHETMMLSISMPFNL